MRFRRASVERLWAEYIFVLAHICHIDPTRPLRLNDFFQLILNADAYIAAQNKE